MKNIKLGVVIAIVVILGAAFWSINSVRTRQYSGADISVQVGSGSVIVNNLGNETIPVEMRATGRSATFRVESPEIDLGVTSRRQGSGRNVYQLVDVELPVGKTLINVTRGSNVVLINSSGTRIEAVVTPMDADGVRWTLGIAGLIILASAFYISGQFGHQFIRNLGTKLPVKNLRLRRNTA